ncbi:MAG TPA: allophanate hydrolase subunit 1 [Nocardioidaceae bacterium]|nr:allophanate hydrolase subunit 1 [Nocardioidaceae bacterium]
MRIIRVGLEAVLVEVTDTAEATALYAEARRRAVEAVDIVPAAQTVLFSGVPDVDALVASLAGWSLDAPSSEDGPVVEVPTRYDGPDLEAVARLWEMTTAEVVRTHTGTEMVVAFCGFAPGFAYCTGLPERLSVPRLDTPRTRVPVGAVGLAGSFTGVYPTASPGGWQLLGRTDLTLWDPSRPEPATLSPGTRVRFVEVGR